jgi:hypothetical protein
MAAEVGHSLALGAMNDLYPWVLVRNAACVFGGAAGDNDNFRAAFL